MSYWHLPEDELYSAMGIEPGFEYFDEFHMPDDLPRDEWAQRLFYEILEDHLGELDQALEHVLDDTRHTAKQLIDTYLKRQGLEPREAEYELWYKNMADDFAQEVYFGLLGGDPEFNEIHLTYMPAMFEWMEMPEDPDFFDAVVEDVYDVGNEVWAEWVEPTILEAWGAAAREVREQADPQEQLPFEAATITFKGAPYRLAETAINERYADVLQQLLQQFETIAGGVRKVLENAHKATMGQQFDKSNQLLEGLKGQLGVQADPILDGLIDLNNTMVGTVGLEA